MSCSWFKDYLVFLNWFVMIWLKCTVAHFFFWKAQFSETHAPNLHYIKLWTDPFSLDADFLSPEVLPAQEQDFVTSFAGWSVWIHLLVPYYKCEINRWQKESQVGLFRMWSLIRKNTCIKSFPDAQLDLPTLSFPFQISPFPLFLPLYFSEVNESPLNSMQLYKKNNPVQFLNKLMSKHVCLNVEIISKLSQWNMQEK